MLLWGTPKRWEILERSRVTCLGEAFQRLSSVLQYEGTHGLAQRGEGRRKEELLGSEQIQTFRPPFRVLHCSSCLPRHCPQPLFVPHHSHFFPSLGLSSSIDGPIYILLLLQVQVKAQPQEAFQDISSLTPFFMKSDSHVHSSMLQTFRRRKTHRRGLHLQVASKGKHEARLLHTK